MKKSLLVFLLLTSYLSIYSQTTSLQTGTILGKIHSADGQPVPYVAVFIPSLGLSKQTDQTGAFHFDKVAAGDQIIQARLVGFDPVTQTVNVRGGQISKVEITLKETSQQLNEVIVNGYVSYYNEVTNLATRTATPILEIPQSIQVIPQQILRDQQAFTINEAMRNVAGMNLFSVYQDYTMRGFRSNDGNFAYNGVRGALYQFEQPGQLFNVEKLEAIKGPASSLFSNASPGGIINIVTKQPLATRGYELSASYGTYNQFRLMADATGPLSTKLFYRLIVGYENSGALSRVQHIRHLFMAPSLRYQFSDRTQATLEINLYDDRRTVGFERGLLAPQRADGTYNLNALPIRWTRHNENDFSKTRGISAQVRFSHQFSSQLSLHAMARSVQSYQEQQDITSGFGDLIIAGVDSLSNRNYQYFKQKPLFSFQGNLYTEVRLQTGPLEHLLIAGMDLANMGRTYYYGSWAAPALAIYTPDFSQDYPVDRSEDNQNFGGYTTENTWLLGGYVQDQISLTRGLKALLGLRYDTYHYKNSSTDDLDPAYSGQDASTATVLLPRLGVVYQPLSMLSLYASYSQGFQPQYSNLNTAGGPFDPERGVQYEMGAKGELLGGKLVPTIAFYHLDKKNILVPDPTDPNGLRQRSDGKARSQGIELTLQGNLTSQLSLITSYAYNQTKNQKGGEFGAPEGSLYPMAPNHTANVWVKYSFTNGPLNRLSLNGGFQHVGQRNTFTEGFVLPGFTTLDAGLSYKLSYKSNGISLALNVSNLTDIRHYTGGYGRGIFWAGMPRSFRLTLGYQF
ncbi:TonB-dependent receptor [Cytophagaceae bacterium DM2B3-1]|uniref:TonB-dependent receptor n=1 Tax=Xanthocytophaga flava TaxID=3048013 RepID=A0ABT7CX17_9BACT|nr:TonB-dependent receptor [Xanthocytophaga flavus]MDJ1498263.1 TonB-dependent receptor [Xanthocytophaga flavus]